MLSPAAGSGRRPGLNPFPSSSTSIMRASFSISKNIFTDFFPSDRLPWTMAFLTASSTHSLMSKRTLSSNARGESALRISEEAFLIFFISLGILM